MAPSDDWDALELDDDALFGSEPQFTQPPRAVERAVRLDPPPPPPQTPRPPPPGPPRAPNSASQLPPSTQASQAVPRIPGPAGNLSSSSFSATQGGAHADAHDDAAPSHGHGAAEFAGGRVRSVAWRRLDELVRDEGARPGAMQAAGRQTLEQVRLAASKPPDVPLRPQLLCVLVKMIDCEGGSGTGEDAAGTLADESGEMACTLHASVFSEHPGCLLPGAALALKRAPVFTLAPHLHHIIVHPSSCLHVIPPSRDPSRRAGA